eukprot:COSAG01_NODE_4879_length_4656_cov_5.636384_2_plen_98_part_00
MAARAELAAHACRAIISPLACSNRGGAVARTLELYGCSLGSSGPTRRCCTRRAVRVVVRVIVAAQSAAAAGAGTGCRADRLGTAAGTVSGAATAGVG